MHLFLGIEEDGFYVLVIFYWLYLYCVRCERSLKYFFENTTIPSHYSYTKIKGGYIYNYQVAARELFHWGGQFF